MHIFKKGENMQLIYIKKRVKHKGPKFFWIIKTLIDKFHYKIKIKKYEKNKIIVTIPFEKEITQKHIYKIIKKIEKRVKEKYKIISLCAECKNDTNLKEMLQQKKYIILDGTWLFLYLLDKIIEYIAQCQKRKVEEYTISILANEGTREEKQTIYNLARNSKNDESHYKEYEKFYENRKTII